MSGVTATGVQLGGVCAVGPAVWACGALWQKPSIARIVWYRFERLK